MALVDRHVPDVDYRKYSLLPAGKHAGHCESHNGAPVNANGSAKPRQDNERITQAKQKKRRQKKKNEGAVAVICQWVVDHQIGLSINLILLHALSSIFIPRARNTTRKFYQLSHYNQASGKYSAGWDDLYLVWYSIVALTGLRAATMEHVLVPLASLGGINKSKERVRFAEQAWILIYYSVFCPLGLSIMYNREHWLNNKELWTGWPSREIDGSMKWYYLVQFSFWLQQIVILAKLLKYMKYQLACDIAFGVFMLVWFVARHVLYPKVVYSVYKDLPEQTRYGCYSGGGQSVKGPLDFPPGYSWLLSPFRDPDGIVCWDDRVKWGFIYALSALEVLFVLWFSMILKVAVKVLKGGGADDSRSDDEDEEEEEEAEIVDNSTRQQPSPPRPYEEEVGVEGITLHKQRSSPVRRFRKAGGVSSGVTLQSDRKELLGRIGCDGGHD
ncbi:uncharacterized protein KY384_000480 [Bacidia gigantensis]|uniref:uncharacterized protein n=1 Tax=Bacidia gigantensis TaxID=2732470 RepID=UPI001D05635E|nr:uncharacterized protein KY384_000480 [Bacidia gigantensis]KAG8525720.1 hypothetical protein KY384_000480 [Bacidia gigantensis]